MNVNFTPIGHVEIVEGNYFIQLNTDSFEAVLGLDEYSHLQVIWWCHLYDNADTRGIRVVDKPYVHGPEKIGILATRSPIRPNPIAITPAQLLHIDQLNNRLQIAFIDAEHDTPILDIKPYQRSVDLVAKATSPDWCHHWPKCYEESATFDWGSEFNFAE